MVSLCRTNKTKIMLQLTGCKNTNKMYNFIAAMCNVFSDYKRVSRVSFEGSYTVYNVE